ncbi:putative histone lysine demethylase PHF8 [Apostichopus japonicus]|uniref:Putative histone lysine demethylase PHF8 n=1 Tax=Stichopus japonicus TaxID=307972 RepID=A0A2G8K126_STIJA|nr:putative histone lysine demethylase PHF8 [Apostichopus japonicus]
MSLKVYDLEKRLKTPQRFQFPWFETTIWFAAKHLIQRIKEDNVDESSKSISYLLDSTRVMVNTLKSWTSRRELRHHLAEIPDSINYTKLIRDLNREMKALEKLQSKKKGKKKNRSKALDDEILEEYEIQPVKVETKVKSKKLTHLMPAQILSPSLKNSPYRAEAQNKSAGRKSAPNKGDLKAATAASDKKFKLVLSNGKVISKTGSVVASKGGFQPLVAGLGEEEIVVDDVSEESKMKTAAEMLAGSSSGPLKLKLSFNGKSSNQGPASSSSKAVHKGSLTNVSGGFDSDEDVMPSDRSPTNPTFSNVDALLQASKLDGAAPLPHISVADIEAELKQQPASPGTQDAIQGMLAIAQPQKTTLNKSDEENMSEGEGRKSRRVRKRKYLDDFDEGDEDMRNCFQDAKYVYPSLDDDEGDVLSPKSRQKYTRRDPGDMPWNPKAKVVMPVPKMNRPHREGVRKAHVEEGLADAKARLANKPTPKRQYIRKKPMPKKPSIEDMPSTSSLAHSLGPYDFKSQFTSTLNQSAPATVLSAMKQEGLGKPRKPKKGMATAKQRLGKILKIQKGGRLLV